MVLLVLILIHTDILLFFHNRDNYNYNTTMLDYMKDILYIQQNPHSIEFPLMLFNSIPN